MAKDDLPRLRAAPLASPPRLVLVDPEIPQNTGNIARLAAALQCPLHLVGKLGFSIDEKAVRRAGRVFNVIGIQSLNPPVMRASIRLYEALMLAPGPLGRDVREMLATVTSRELDCFY